MDVEAFEEASTAARRARHPAAYRRALELYAGDLLPEDRYEGWVEERRRQSKTLHLDLLAELAALHEQRGELEPAIEALQLVVANERADE